MMGMQASGGGPRSPLGRGGGAGGAAGGEGGAGAQSPPLATVVEIREPLGSPPQSMSPPLEGAPEGAGAKRGIFAGLKRMFSTPSSPASPEVPRES